MQTTYYALDHYEFIRISGADSLSFLQGQISCDTDMLSAERSLNGALCNLKGRVIADFRLLQLGEDCLMQCAAGMAQPILDTLGKYAVFSKVELELLQGDAAPAALGLIDEAADQALAQLELTLPEAANGVCQADSCSVIRQSGPVRRIEVWFYSSAARDTFLSNCGIESSEDLAPWQRAEVEAGMVHVTPALSEEYTPQLLNYDISGLIDFKKGCYTGQEIVARMYYRGTGKKRLYLASSNTKLGENSRVLTEGEAEAEGSAAAGGEVLSYSNDESGALLLAILASDAVEAGERLMLAGEPESVLQLLSLPYGANTEQAIA